MIDATNHKTPDKRYTVAKASGSRYAYVIDSQGRRPPERFAILKGDGWTRAEQLCARLNAAPQPPATVERKPLTDEEITQLWGDLQARKIKESRAAHADQIGKVCGACEAGTFFLDSNGYNNFPRCNQCKHVPFLLNGVDMSVAIMAKKSAHGIQGAA